MEPRGQRRQRRESSSRPAQQAGPLQRARRLRAIALGAVAVLAIGGGGLGYYLSQRLPAAGGQARCPSGYDRVEIAADASTAPLIDKLAKIAVLPSCVKPAPVEAASPKTHLFLRVTNPGFQVATSALSDTGAGEAPSAQSPTTLADIAVSPLVLALPPAAATPATWAEATALPGLVVPQINTPGAGFALLTAVAGTQKPEGSQHAVTLAQLAQVEGAAGATARGTSSAQILASGEGKAPAVALESEFHAAGIAGLRATAPGNSSPAAHVALELRGADETEEALARALTKAAATPEGRRAVRETGWRAATETTSPPPGPALTGASVAPEPDALQAVAASTAWRALTAPSKAIIVVDVSGSMGLEAGGDTRIGVVTRGLTQAVPLLPINAQVGLWAFNRDLGGPGVDYRQLLAPAPVGRAAVSEHSRALAAQIAALPTLIKGDTGLYDTVAAAFASARANYLPGTVNTVVVITDGANEDDDSITAPQLTQKLREIQAGGAPIALRFIAISPQADAAALEKIAGQVGGQVHRAADPADMGVIFRGILASLPGTQ